MYTYKYSIDNLEQGTIGSGGNSDSTTVIRTSGYLKCPKNPGIIKVTAISESGKTIQVDFLGYKDSSTSSPLCDLYWYNSPCEFNISSYKEISYFRLCLKYSDNSKIIPSDISECNLTVDFVWIMGDNGKPYHKYLAELPEAPLKQPYPKAVWRIKDGRPYHDFLLPLAETPLAKPYPKTVWRIDPLVNNGKSYHDMLPDVYGIDMWSLERERTIRVYDMSEPQDGFKHNGLAVLNPVSCKSLHNEDVWDVDLVHPIDEWGKWKFLLAENILKVDGQLFRINIQESEFSESGGFLTVHAHHITEDMADDIIKFATFGGGTASQFLDFCFKEGIEETDDYYHVPYKFGWYTDIDTYQGESEYTNVTLWGAIVGVDNCFVNRYGGELYRNNFYFSVCKRMEKAKDNAFNLRYSLDMTKIKQKVDYTNLCTNLDCFDNFGNEFGVSYTSDSRWAIHHPKRRMYQFNYSTYEIAVVQLDIDSMALWEQISSPKVTYEMQMISLNSDPRYEDFLRLQNYNYGDSGTISCPELDISTIQKITEIEKDEITGDLISMKLGNISDSLVRPTFMGSTISSGHDLEDKQNKVIQNTLIGTSVANAEKYSINRLETLSINELQGG